MYIYFDRNGTIQEVINDESIRKGSNDYNKIYCYLEGNPDIDDIWYLQKNPDGTLTKEVSFVDKIVKKAIPYDSHRDMKYFQDFEEYQFYVFTLSSSYLLQSGLVVATIRVEEDNTMWALGELTFNVQANVINSDNEITQSQYDYLLITISSYYSKTEIDNKLSLKADKSTTYTKTEVNSALATKADKSDTYTKAQVDEKDLNLAGQIAGARVELNNRINTTNGILTATQAEVAKLKSVQNVVEVVATYSALQSYDTTKLDVNDKVQVIADETHDGASTIYNWNGSAWVYVGAYGTNSYTKQESDNKFALKSTAVTHTGNQLKDNNGNNFYPNLDDDQIETKNIKDLNITAPKTNFMTDNVFYHNDEVNVRGTVYWNGTGIEFDVSTINEGDVYYLKIDSVTNNMTSDVALLRTWQNGVAYAVRTMTITQVQNGDTINILIPSDCTRFGVWLMRNNSGSTTASGTTTFSGVNLYKNSDHLVRTLANDVVIPQLNDDVKKLGYWYGKKITWFGTSIPAGSYDASNEHRYPDIVGSLLGATVYNEAVGSSSITRCNPNSITEDNPYGFDTNDWLYAVRGLAQTLEEKQWLLDNYNNADVFTVNTWDFLDDYRRNLVKSYSYEQKIAKYLTGGSVGNVDLYVFDHGFNDIFNNTTYSYSNLKETYGENNRYCYQGGMNYLLNYIFTKNPDAKVIILSHYSDNATDHTHNTTTFVEALKENQIAVAKRWNLNFLDLTSMLGWSGQKITTTGYWDSDTHEWVNSGGASQEIQIKDIHVRDTVHPYTDASGKSNNRIAEVIATYLNDLVR